MELEGFWTFIFIIVASTLFIFSMTRRSADEPAPPENDTEEKKAQ
jgi:hypothetical protein